MINLMMSVALTAGLLMAAWLVVMAIGYVVSIAVFFKKVTPGQAIIRSGMGQRKVSFHGMWVIPFLHRADYVDISAKKVPLSFPNQDPLIFHDNKQALFFANAMLRVNMTVSDVLRIAQVLGPEATFSEQKMIDLFQNHFREATQEAAKTLRLPTALEASEVLKMQIIETIGQDLNGVFIDDIHIKEFNPLNN